MPPSVLNADSIVRALQGAFCRDASRHELLQLAATRIRQAGPPYTGAYLYMLYGDVLRRDGNCAEVVWTFLGLSIPAWTLLAFTAIAGAALYLLFRNRRAAAD